MESYRRAKKGGGESGRRVGKRLIGVAPPFLFGPSPCHGPSPRIASFSCFLGGGAYDMEAPEKGGRERGESEALVKEGEGGRKLLRSERSVVGWK